MSTSLIALSVLLAAPAAAQAPEVDAPAVELLAKKPRQRERAPRIPAASAAGDHPASRAPSLAQPAPRKRPSPQVHPPMPDRASPRGEAPDRTPAWSPPGRTDRFSRAAPQSHSAVTRGTVRDAPRAALRPYDLSDRRTATAATRITRPWQTADHRFARPHPRYVTTHPEAHHPPPDLFWYRPRYAHWYVHPYWRHYHVTVVVVALPFPVHPWAVWWVPPVRPGWVWIPGYRVSGYWHPGYWAPVAPPPARYGMSWVYVPGWWEGTVYVDGYWRPAHRPGDDWVWVDGYYLEDGTYVRGHWRPGFEGPEGYVWEAGFFDGEVWVEGFWRPEYRAGYVWVSSWYDGDGIYHSGYWEPLAARPGQVWIPGWFDGHEWIEGYWVAESRYREADPAAWTPAEGWNAGWGNPLEPPQDAAGAVPLALPVLPADE